MKQITQKEFNKMLTSGEIKLPEKFKQEWLKALRSGDYKQGGMLYEKLDGKDTYCCLGVAGKIAGLTNEELDRKGVYSTSCFMERDLIKFNEVLPDMLVSHNDLDVAHHLQLKLAKFNDGTTHPNPDVKDIPPKTFEEIADWIEKTL